MLIPKSQKCRIRLKLPILMRSHTDNAILTPCTIQITIETQLALQLAVCTLRIQRSLESLVLLLQFLVLRL